MEPTQHNLFCPICKSPALSANKQTFNNTNALLGNMAFGTSGLKYGLIGTGKVNITCLACGYEFKPGEGATETDFEEKHALAIKKQEEIKSSRQNKRALAFFLLLIIIIVMIVLYNAATS